MFTKEPLAPYRASSSLDQDTCQNASGFSSDIMIRFLRSFSADSGISSHSIWIPVISSYFCQIHHSEAGGLLSPPAGQTMRKVLTSFASPSPIATEQRERTMLNARTKANSFFMGVPPFDLCSHRLTRWNHPLMAPIITPLAKKRCTKGKISRIGRVEITMTAYFSPIRAIMRSA